MEKRTEVKKTRKVTLHCDECGGEMLPTGTALMTNPPQYPHECRNCGNIKNIFGKTYPYFEYEEI